MRKFVFVSGSLCGLVLVAMVALWWRLSSGPIELDLATPWLTAAIKENFGAGHDVEIGGTQLERDANGRTSLRIRDIVVRDADGTVVASAPKAEVGVSGTGLMTGRVRAERLSLVGAEMAVRIETDSKVTVFAGGNKRPFVTASAMPQPRMPVRRRPLRNSNAPPRSARLRRPLQHVGRAAAGASAVTRNGVPDFAALLAWIDEPRRQRARWPRPRARSASRRQSHRRRSAQRQAVDVHQHRSQRDAAEERRHRRDARLGERRAALVCARGDDAGRAAGHRIIDIETQKVSAKDLMLAMRLGDESVRARSADLGAHPRRHRARRHSADARRQDPGGQGRHHRPDDPLARIPIDRAEINLDWDATRQALVMPFQVVSGGNRITLLAQFDAPREGGGIWGLAGLRRHGRAGLRRAGRSEAAHPQPDPAAAADRSGQAAHRHRAGRVRQHRSRRRALRQPRLFQRRPAAGARHCRHAHVGRGDEAAVADLHRAEGARLGRRACRWAARSSGW